jgi:hypothetical protein
MNDGFIMDARWMNVESIMDEMCMDGWMLNQVCIKDG